MLVASRGGSAVSSAVCPAPSQRTPDCLSVEYDYLNPAASGGNARGRQYLLRNPCLVLPRYRVDIRVTPCQDERSSPARPTRLPPSIPSSAVPQGGYPPRNPSPSPPLPPLPGVPPSPTQQHQYGGHPRDHGFCQESLPREAGGGGGGGILEEVSRYMDLPLSSALQALVANVECFEREVAERVGFHDRGAEAARQSAQEGTQRALRAKRNIKSRFDMLARLLESKRNDLLEKIDSRDRQRRESLNLVSDEQKGLSAGYAHLLSLASVVNREKMDRRATGLPTHASPSASLTQAVEALQLASTLQRRESAATAPPQGSPQRSPQRDVSNHSVTFFNLSPSFVDESPIRQNRKDGAASPPGGGGGGAGGGVGYAGNDPVYDVDLIEVMKSIEDVDLVENPLSALPSPPEPRVSQTQGLPPPHGTRASGAAAAAQGSLRMASASHSLLSGGSSSASAYVAMGRTTSTLSAATAGSSSSGTTPKGVYPPHAGMPYPRSVSPGRRQQQKHQAQQQQQQLSHQGIMSPSRSPPHTPPLRSLSPVDAIASLPQKYPSSSAVSGVVAPPRPESLSGGGGGGGGGLPLEGANASHRVVQRSEVSPRQSWSPVLGDSVVCSRDAHFRNLAEATGAAKWHEALTIDASRLDAKGLLAGPAGTSIATEWTLQFNHIEGAAEVGLLVVGLGGPDEVDAEEDRLVAIPQECISEPLILVVRLTVRSGGRPPSLSLYALEGTASSAPETRLITRTLAPFNLSFPYYAASVLRGRGEVTMVSPPIRQTSF
eukprot:TRINITY_DN22230_c2_g1_i1.p1 TRINITY_DN22230_c2_g1~~TRINITY_DN22230_c2_g1_i1.p1  ORF type:complete len:775 (+),score=172.53 TRINITY_DN22230_c2_g1_i1:3-2327(+)